MIVLEPRKRKTPRKPQYKCPVCSEIIEGRLNFESHVSKVHNKFRCEDCHSLYDNAEELFWHRDEKHKNECEHCNIAFASKQAMYNHFGKVHSDLNNFKCERCNKEFPIEAMLAQHKRVHDRINVRVYQCNICGKVLKSADSFKGHHLVHLPKEQKNCFLCSVCGKGYPTACKLKYHMRFHTGETPYQCDKCPKAFRNQQNFKLHARVHVVGKPFKCDKCTAGFKHHRDLYKHKKDRHEGEWKYKCIACPSIFPSETEVDMHYNTHTNEEQSKHRFSVAKFTRVSDFQCFKCEKYFLNSGTLSNHKTMHKRRKIPHGPRTWKRTEKSDFMCDICGVYLAQKMSLVIHLRTHMEKKPFSCELCGKGFITKQFLEDHVRVHTGETPYMCDFCGKQFSRKANMTKHKRTVHLNLRPYECKVCKKAFKTGGALVLHTRIHTGERPYVCDICHRDFTQKPDMTRHRMRHSPEDIARANLDEPSSSTAHNVNKVYVKTTPKPSRTKKSTLSERIAKRSLQLSSTKNSNTLNNDTYTNVTIVQTGESEYTLCNDSGQKSEQEIEFYVL